jgi:hypothetical protein
MSKIEANRFELAPVNYRFRDMIGRVSDLMEFKANERRQHFEVQVYDSIPEVVFGEDQR